MQPHLSCQSLALNLFSYALVMPVVVDDFTRRQSHFLGKVHCGGIYDKNPSNCMHAFGLKRRLSQHETVRALALFHAHTPNHAYWLERQTQSGPSVSANRASLDDRYAFASVHSCLPELHCLIEQRNN
ncbi:hypothetical protein RSOLAG1IB_00534 [Rhizoctonia solani AG-1 IB]|uniref:Uncharacterized protein n=1 Tax=Thanatephorus cucumeris (strain AG1-IB / isolate 7/3/14) TaxID=1108050 RepID=A0A0B7F6Z8_THACB|nr:hypothetical protein RSOLAG1IB_00534 [Rhizoctonia solani AG-1 IB]